MKLDRFINRPVLSTVISILIVILGILGLLSLPITQYPDIAPPTVSVKATYTGANAQTVLNSVIAPLEDQINGVENMMYMTSSASNNGSAEISIYFKQGTDPDMAAVNVQNRVSMAQGLLPAEVTQIGVTTQKRQNSMLIVFSVYDAEDRYDQRFIENYAKINLIPEVQRVPGVGDANVLGTDYSMRIWLKPDVMAQYKLVPNDVAGVLAEQNVEAAPGSFGERGNQSFQYTIRYKGRLQEVSEFENMVVKALPDGEVLRLKDIADIELGRLTYNFVNKVNGHSAVTCIVYQMAGTNATETINNIQNLLEETEKILPPGLKIDVGMNANDFLYASIHEVLKTLIEAFILVFIVVYIFLQDLRSTLIPAIAIPVALIGTFFMLSLIGFSLNLLTLCAMVLANTLHELKWDGRFSYANKHWAEKIYIPTDLNHNSDFVVRSHPAVLDGFVSFYRKAVQALNLFGAEHCVGDRAEQDYTGKVLVLSPDTLKESCWSQENQLWYAHDGFGCSPHAIGRSVRCTCLSDGEMTRWNRSEFIGVLDDKFLPEWAKPKLAELNAQEQTDAPTMGSMNMK